MLTERVEVNVLDDDHLAVVLLELGRIEYGAGVHTISSCQGLHGFGHTLGCLHQSFALGIFAQQSEYLTVVLFQFGIPFVNGIVTRIVHHQSVILISWLGRIAISLKLRDFLSIRITWSASSMVL